jgi:Na+-transporting NADH:ubiquinone oxidoreductase subunit A
VKKKKGFLYLQRFCGSMSKQSLDTRYLQGKNYNNQMRNRIALIFLTIVLSSDFLLAQSGQAGSNNWFIYLILATVVILFFLVMVNVSDNMLAIEAKRMGIKEEGGSFSVFPSLSDIFPKEAPAFVGEGEQMVRLKQGHDILLEGAAEAKVETAKGVTTYAVTIPDFVGISPIPKMMVEVGDNVKAGDPLFFDKKRPEIIHTAPVSGEVIDIKRGAKRSIHQVIILADKDMQYKSFDAPNIETTNREDIVQFMLASGAWAFLRQRPYNITPDPEVTPRDIYITTFDTAPLAPDLNLVVAGREAAFQKGLDVLAKLTDGRVHLGLDSRKGAEVATIFTQATGVQKNWFAGKHPAGNVGVQIHNTQPISAGEVIWTPAVQDVIALGELFLSGKYDTSRVIALAGAELKETKYVRTYLGARLGELLKDNLTNDHIRIISGDVLSGTKRSEEDFLGVFDDQVTVVEEGDDYEAFGWLLPIKPRPSVSGTFPTTFIPGMKFKAETNTHGEKRAFVVTGLYEKMLPMDIYLQHLMKSILIGDLEQMEGLGIYELVEEDIALAEFACVSKQPLQSILRDGLDKMRQEG